MLLNMATLQECRAEVVRDKIINYPDFPINVMTSTYNNTCYCAPSSEPQDRSVQQLSIVVDDSPLSSMSPVQFIPKT